MLSKFRWHAGVHVIQPTLRLAFVLPSCAFAAWHIAHYMDSAFDKVGVKVVTHALFSILHRWCLYILLGSQLVRAAPHNTTLAHIVRSFLITWINNKCEQRPRTALRFSTTDHLSEWAQVAKKMEGQRKRAHDEQRSATTTKHDRHYRYFVVATGNSFSTRNEFPVQNW